jgi:serine protease Do
MKIFQTGLFVLLICIGGGLWYTAREIKNEQKSLRKALDVVRTEQDQLAELRSHIDISPDAVEVITQSELWRPIQDSVKDTVVQVFSQIAEFDFLQPYKTPSQYSAYGTAFFINDQGDLITNAHVINQARAIWIQIPSLGKQIIDVEMVSISPERDIALLRLTPEGKQKVLSQLGKIPYLKLGNSDNVFRSDEVMALGYPLGQQSLKSTTGVISGRERNMIQMDAALNPGNSGGPTLNKRGEVVGINTAIVAEAQSVGYFIPINDLNAIKPDLYKVSLLRKPFLGVLFNNASEQLTQYLGNPGPGGCYVVEVVKDSTLFKAGIERGDMLYAINGHAIDIYGEMKVPWSEDKISLVDYVSRISIGEDVTIVAYRKGKKKEVSVKFSQTELPPIREVYPGYEPIDYEIFGGMVLMQLTFNHIHVMKNNIHGLMKYVELANRAEPVLLITHIFPNSQLHRSRALTVGATINEVNGVAVHTLEEFRKVLKNGMHEPFMTVRATDNLSRTSDNILVALAMDKVVQEEQRLSTDFRYQLTDLSRDIITGHHNRSIKIAKAPKA